MLAGELRAQVLITQAVWGSSGSSPSTELLLLSGPAALEQRVWPLSPNRIFNYLSYLRNSGTWER